MGARTRARGSRGRREKRTLSLFLVVVVLLVVGDVVVLDVLRAREMRGWGEGEEVSYRAEGDGGKTNPNERNIPENRKSTALRDARRRAGWRAPRRWARAPW